MFNAYVTIAVVVIAAIISTLSCMAWGFKDAYDDLIKNHESLRERYDDRLEDLENSFAETRVLKSENAELRRTLHSSRKNINLISDILEKALKV
jgi:hypothetical protein